LCLVELTDGFGEVFWGLVHRVWTPRDASNLRGPSQLGFCGNGSSWCEGDADCLYDISWKLV
jgi:hypothetical protein